MPAMLYGTAWKGDRTAALVVQAVLAGFRGIDTACQPKHYQQRGVGTAIRELRERHGIARGDLFVQTKYTPLGGQDRSKPLPYEPDAPLEEQVNQSLATSLRELGTDYLDAVLLHSPLERPEETARVWKVFEDALEQGSVRRLGLSNIYDPEELAHYFDTFRVKPSIMFSISHTFGRSATEDECSQNRFYAATDYDGAILDLCAKHGAQYQAFWTLTVNPNILKSGLLRKIATEARPALPLTPAQALYYFLLTTERWPRGMIVPLSGTTNLEHMEHDVDVQRLVAEEQAMPSRQELAAALWPS